MLNLKPVNTWVLRFLIFVAAAGVHAEAMEARDIAGHALPASVAIITFNAAGNPFAQGSGFFISSRRIVTNFHVIRDASSIRARNASGDLVYLSKGILFQDANKDLAIIEVDRDSMKILTLGDSDRVVVGEKVYAVGSPAGYSGTFTEGLVSGLRSIEGKSLIQISAPISHGSSGGPVLDSNGNVIGVSVGGHTTGQNLNFAIPINELKSAMARLGSLAQKDRGASSSVEPVVADPKLISMYTGSFPTMNFTKWEFTKNGSGYDFTVSARTTKRVKIDEYNYPPGVDLFLTGNTEDIQSPKSGTHVFRRVRILNSGR